MSSPESHRTWPRWIFNACMVTCWNRTCQPVTIRWEIEHGLGSHQCSHGLCRDMSSLLAHRAKVARLAKTAVDVSSLDVRRECQVSVDFVFALNACGVVLLDFVIRIGQSNKARWHDGHRMEPELLTSLPCVRREVVLSPFTLGGICLEDDQ